MGRYLCLIFEDYHKKLTVPDVSLEDFKALMKRDGNDKSSKTQDSNILSKTKRHFSFVHSLNYDFLEAENNTSSPKSDDWLNAAMLKIAPTIESVKILIGNKSTKVRLELARLSTDLLEKCFK